MLAVGGDALGWDMERAVVCEGVVADVLWGGAVVVDVGKDVAALE